MGRRRSVMSESFKYELAKDLGFYDVVQREGWEGIRTKDAGNMVKRAIQIAEEHLAKQNAPAASVNEGQTSYSQPGYLAVSTPTTYTQQSYAQGAYGSAAQQAQSNYQPNYMSEAYNVNTFVPNQNQPSSPIGYPNVAGSQSSVQAGQRPYYS